MKGDELAIDFVDWVYRGEYAVKSTMNSKWLTSTNEYGTTKELLEIYKNETTSMGTGREGRTSN